MTEPTTTIASSVAAVSMMATALFGFDYHSMVWGLLGALIAARQGPSSEWLRAMAAALLSMLVGAMFAAKRERERERKSNASETDLVRMYSFGVTGK